MLGCQFFSFVLTISLPVYHSCPPIYFYFILSIFLSICIFLFVCMSIYTIYPLILELNAVGAGANKWVQWGGGRQEKGQGGCKG